MQKTVRTAVLAAALAGAQAAAASPNVAIHASAVRSVAERVTNEVGPVVDHLTNAEPWYRSRVTWGAIISAGIPIIGAFGVATDWINPDELAAIAVATVSAAGGLLTLYGRWKARKPETETVSMSGIGQDLSGCACLASGLKSLTMHLRHPDNQV